MSWAAERETTRNEDVAYCLMGIFDINMPLLYGEVPKAFIRLQEEIMRYSNDQSLFAWSGNSDPTFGMLAASPSCFARRPSFRYFQPHAHDYAFSKTGIAGFFTLRPYGLNIFAAELGWFRVSRFRLAIFLQRQLHDSYRRVRVDGRSSILYTRRDLGVDGRERRQIRIGRLPTKDENSQHLPVQVGDSIRFGIYSIYPATFQWRLANKEPLYAGPVGTKHAYGPENACIRIGSTRPCLALCFTLGFDGRHIVTESCFDNNQGADQ